MPFVHHVRLGLLRGAADGLHKPLPLRRQLGQPKIQNLCGAFVHQENIRGLDVPVNNPFHVRCFQSVGNLDRHVQNFRDHHRLGGDPVLQRLALQQLHGDKWPTLEFANVVNRADIRMVQRGSRARFAPEPLNRLRVLGNVVGKKLQRHVAAQARILGLIDHAHSPTAQFFQHVVVGDSAASNRSSIRHRHVSVAYHQVSGKLRRRESCPSNFTQRANSLNPVGTRPPRNFIWGIGLQSPIM